MDSLSKHICLWSGPRNISTALMYSFAQRQDTTVVDEPLYAHYLSSSDSAKNYHPLAQEVLNSMENDGQKVIENMFKLNKTPFYFHKQMTHHLIDIDWSFLLNTTNIILTRNPKEMLPSFAKEISNPKMYDVGYQMHIDLLEYLNNNNCPPIVIDSKELLLNPKPFLTELCVQLNIPFNENMLSWKKGARSEDGVWAKHWYGNVHQSTGFIPYKEKTEPFPSSLAPLLKECEPLYQKLKAIAIKV